MKGLYFYKLVSSYAEDITKDCKLTVNEIDHNFITLKDADIREFRHDKDNDILVLVRNNGEELNVDVSNFTKNLSVVYDPKCGVIEIHHDGKVDRMTGLITVENLEEEIKAHLKNIRASVMVDGTLVGNGNDSNPLGMNVLEKTSAFKGVTRLIDRTKGESLPSLDCNGKGDRYVIYEGSNEYGYLYDYPHAKKFVEDLESEWRLPSKADWDGMLNAIELCNEDRTHDIATCNNMLGKMAGKYLKSVDGWALTDEECCCQCNHHEDEEIFDDETTETNKHECCHPKCKSIKPSGVDSYGFKVLPAGYGDGYMILDYFTRRTRFWTSSVSHVSSVYMKRFDFDKNGVVQTAEAQNSLASVRLVKDYDGNNFQEFVTLNGITYRAVLMPSLASENGCMIWLAANIADSDCKYKPVAPNNGDMVDADFKYYMCEWDGFSWKKKEMEEGDSIVMEFGVDGRRNEEYRLMDGKLVNVGKKIVEEVEAKYDKAIAELDARLDIVEADVEFLKGEIKRIDEVNDQQWQAIENEAKVREEVDNQLWEAIAKEATAREEVDAQLWEAIAKEATAREEVDAQLWEGIANEATARMETDNQLWEGIAKEATAREEVDAQLWKAIEEEAIARETVDADLWKAIENEAIARETVDADLWEAINTESTIREDIDNQIWTALNAEIERSKAEDEYIKGRLISKEGSTFECAKGVLTLVTDNPENTIVIKLDSDYGTF